MAISTVAFCRQCKWRSSVVPGHTSCAGNACPNCGTGVSCQSFDPTYVGTDILGKPYNEQATANAHLTSAGVSTTPPVALVPLPVAAVVLKAGP